MSMMSNRLISTQSSSVTIRAAAPRARQLVYLEETQIGVNQVLALGRDQTVWVDSLYGGHDFDEFKIALFA